MRVFSQEEGKKWMNALGRQAIPFFFLIDFDKKAPIVVPLSSLDKKDLRFNIEGFSNQKESIYDYSNDIVFAKEKITKSDYRIAFDKVMQQIYYGNSYLSNLTFSTRIMTNLSLSEIYDAANAPYKLWVKDHFVVFSPEPFVTIQDRRISTFPMKGTIDANLPNAKALLENNPKEISEHATIVDLLRNDLSQVAKEVRVRRYRYFDKVDTINGKLWQTSSEIEGKLPTDYQNHLGDILFQLLPAGSICGAPKRKTLEIIRSVEIHNRGYYTGVFGVFDGVRLRSAVAIRFIEQIGEQLVFKSGGGITCQSQLDEEYDELNQKIYLPFVRQKYALPIA